MANLFDTDNAPELEPDKIVVGDRSVWRKVNLASDYPSTSYSAAYVSRMSSGGGSHEFTVTGVVDGNVMYRNIVIDSVHHHQRCKRRF